MSQPLRARRPVVITALGVTQIIGFGSTYYLPAVLAQPISADTGWSFTWVVSGISLATLVGGVSAPLIGRIIQAHGGRPVLAASAVVTAAGLALMGFAPTLAIYLLAWVIVGIGMATGLYDAVFSALGRHYGASARSAISWVTLFGGFASTICWPLSAWLVENYGWRETCFVYAGLYLAICLPAFLLFSPTEMPKVGEHARQVVNAPETGHSHRTSLFLLAAILTLASLIASIVAVHLISLLQLGGMSLATAVAFGTIVGPAQVAGRVGELVFGKSYHPIWAMLAAVTAMALGMACLLAGQTLTALALLLFGAGNGVLTIAKGALPLVLFDPREYALVMGKLAAPALIMQALAPAVAAYAIENGAGTATLMVLLAVSLANIGLALILYWRRIR